MYVCVCVYEAIVFFLSFVIYLLRRQRSSKGSSTAKTRLWWSWKRLTSTKSIARKCWKYRTTELLKRLSGTTSTLATLCKWTKTSTVSSRGVAYRRLLAERSQLLSVRRNPTEYSSRKSNRYKKRCNAVFAFRPEIKATVIYPATPKHIEKYSRQEALYVRETPELYREKVEPFLRENCFSTQWVYNVLEHKREQENILFEDDDKKVRSSCAFFDNHIVAKRSPALGSWNLWHAICTY